MTNLKWMKRFFIFFITILLFCSPATYAQNTSGTDFWLTFGKNYFTVDPYYIDLQIRIVSGNHPATGTIYFTSLGDSIPFNIPAHQVFTYSLSNEEKHAVYNTATGIFNSSIRVQSFENPVMVYALNQDTYTTDATNVLPVTALSNNYYQISYTPVFNYSFYDAYAVIAIADSTIVFHNEDNVATLNTGEVYFRTSLVDMTGDSITTNNPVAFFALNQGVYIPSDSLNTDCLMQQLPPVNTWGKEFFVPVSHLTKERVRIVASQDNTAITQTGGELKSAEGSQMRLDSLKAGQFVELEVYLDSAGCYIEADKPVGVCAYLIGGGSPPTGSDPSQSWIAPIEQTVKEAIIAPFIPEGNTSLTDHRAIVVTPTATKNNTQVSIGGASPIDLSGVSWVDNDAAEMSFYNMPLTNDTASYHFTNAAGLFVMGYGTGSMESYYYLAAGGMRNLTCAFYANEVYYADLVDTAFDNSSVNFRAEIEELSPNQESLKWYINGVEETSAQDQLQWSHSFACGQEYEITLWVRHENNTTSTITGILKIKKLWIKIQNFQRK